MRTFISLNFDAETRKIIAGYKNKIRGLLTEDDKRKIKWESEDKYHITLYFLGETSQSQAEQISAAMNTFTAKDIGDIGFNLKCISAFPDRKNPRVLFVDVLNPDGKSFVLSRKINDMMSVYGFKNDKVFKPHITIGRIKRNYEVNFENINQSCNNEFIKISKLYFMSSILNKEGSSYKEILGVCL